ncbi:MAG: LysM peptidoglycan-binding domain-containing protein [Bacilli bacterium]|nr:LysM peptidoglycan-binding domain-containing protein [Bacilli bacterium]
MNNNIKVIVDAGHGGEDPGAVGNNVLEKDLNLRAAKYMYKRLQELNIPSVIIRDTDETLPKNERIKRVLEAYNNEPNTILISNHINAGGGEGAEIVYALRNNNTLANLALNNIGEKGQIKRSAYQRVLPENPSKDYYYILRETGNTEPLLIEYGFIDNPNDIRKLNNNLEDYVEGVVKAIADYAGYEYIEPNKESNKEYIVRKGDTLYSISRRFNIPVEELKRINNLTSDVLSIGTTLYLQDSENNSTYIVKKGDTLYKIASIYNTTIDSIKELNNLTSNILTIGQELLIPSSNEPIIPEQTTNYIVQKGDSLWSISKKFNTTVDELIELNNLSTINLQVGDILLIPKQENINKIYIVEPKDTLWSIAKKNNISVEKLKELNNLTSNLLSIGQELIIA